MIRPQWKKYVSSKEPGQTHITLQWNGSYLVSLCGYKGSFGQEWEKAEASYCQRCVQLARKRKNPAFDKVLQKACFT